MQWIVLLAALCVLFLLVWKTRRKPAAFRLDTPLEDALGTHLTAVAQQADAKGYARVHSRRHLLPRLENALVFLNRFSDEELLPAARWLCDNARFLQEEAAGTLLAQKTLPRLPRSASAEACLAVFAREWLCHANAAITPEHLQSALSAWQAALPLTAAELDALPTVLRLTLLELLCRLSQTCAANQQASQAAQRASAFSRHSKERQALRLCRRFAGRFSFLERLLSLEGETEWLSEQLKSLGLSADELTQREQKHQTELCLWVGNAITSLRVLSRLGWDDVLENASAIHAVLQKDGIYQRMDQESRAAYRARVADIAHRTHLSERAVASGVWTLCQSAREDSLEAHSGYYLLDDGYRELLEHLHALSPRLRLSLWASRHAGALFRMTSWAGFALLLFAGWTLGITAWMWLPFAVVTLYALQQLLLVWKRRRVPPRPVPRLALKSLTEELQTLVVCPTMLTSAKHALAMVKHLSIMHEANPDEHLHFLLLGDFQDSLTGTLATDAEIMATASAAIEALCEDTGHPFFYMQRERAYAPGENAHHSRERKRGSLETLLRLIAGRPIRDSFAASTVDPAWFQGKYRYVITLDSDTLLPPGAALRLVGAIQHPLSRRQKHRHSMRGFSIIQPRMETAAHTVTSPLSALLGGTGGTDTYNLLSSDTDHDWFRRGTFMGKGILDPVSFLDATETAIPDGLVLSHDLLEGELAGCAYASDIVLYDGHPQTLKGFLYRLHRWTRGDWQLLPYVLPVFPKAYQPPRKALDGMGRFKICRNLFRSLVAPLRMALLLYGAASGRAWLWLIALLLPELPWLGRPFLPHAASLFCRLAILPCEAWMQADAILRTLYRLFYSRRHLLAWTTSAQISGTDHRPPMLFFSISMGSAALFAVSMLWPTALWPCCLIPAAGWVGFSFALPFLEQERRSEPRPTDYMREVLLRLARQTLTFFETAITPEDHALPPDNVQIDPNKGIAHRTSPTNIGLYLCALAAAQKLGLLEEAEFLKRVDETITTLEKLPKWENLPYNWYDTRTLEPLGPRFVSSVDCGNLAVCLLTCAQGVRMLLSERTENYASLAARMDEMANAMHLELLYDPDAGLFRIGIEADSGNWTASHYDLLASEARLLSFAAIMLRKVPLKHWFRLGRPLAARGALVSYSGTMFEYLMPLLFQPLVHGTLLDSACRTALRAQRAHRLGGAFGVSESGYYAFDPELNYQYKAFGLPVLALDAGIRADVLAPYASMLSLTLDLPRAFRNLQRMHILGLEGPLGLFEAADFSSDCTRNMRIVRSHMAHHQGMILCAVCNALEHNYIATLFSNLPRAQAYRLLLEEHPARAAALVRRPLKRPRRKEPVRSHTMARDAKPLCFPVDALLLAGGGARWIIDAQGGGGLWQEETALTRFDKSCARPSGMRLYLRDSQSGAFWLPTDPYLVQTVRFEAAQAVFTHVRFDIRGEVRMWVNPLDGSVVQLVTLENRTGVERLMEVCSYLEPSLMPQREEGVHPAFQNLFIQTARMGKYGVSATRRPKETGEAAKSLWHLLVSETDLNLLRVQTDRLAFLGRNRSFQAPRALAYPIGALADSFGDVVEPCLSLRGQFLLPAQGKAVFAFVTHMAKERETPQAFCDRYAGLPQVLRTYDSAQVRAHVMGRFLRLSPDEQAEISRLTGALAYTGQPMEAHANVPGRELPLNEIWRFGISGDHPILLLECRGTVESALFALLEKAHAWHRMNGMPFDWVIEITDTPRAAQLRAQMEADLPHGHEGIYLLLNPTEAESKLLRAHARLVLRADTDLAHQLEEQTLRVLSRPLYVYRPSAQWKAELPPVEETVLSNGYGGFTPGEGNYQITLPPGVSTPAPWCHPLCSQTFGTLASESGLVFSYAQNSQSGQLTRWPCDAVSARGDETFYLRDQEHHLLWSLCRQPLGSGMPVRITYAPGEALYESSAYGLYARLHCFTDAQLDMGLRLIQIKNESQTKRELMLYHRCSFAKQPFLKAEEGRIVGEVPELSGVIGLMAVDTAPSETAVMSEGLFQGLWSELPFALSGVEKLPAQRTGHTAVLAYSLHLLPGESAVLTDAIGFATTADALENARQILRRDGTSERLHALRAMWEESLGRLQFDLPDAALSILMNRWLPYQTQASRLWMRAGYYQAGGAIGFRDQLQDMLSLLLTHPDEVRAHLLLCAAHQFEEGDVQHWWHPPRYGVRTRISDDKLFLPFVTALYVETTGDRSVLEENVPYLTGEPLREYERERLFEPEVSQTSEPLSKHCLRAIRHVRLGAHELPLMGSGDWNDGMNRAAGESGESVWLGMFLCEVLRRFAPCCPEEEAAELKQMRLNLLKALDRYAWDGAWYLRGWYHDGKPLGSGANSECRLDLLPQSWGVLCGVSRDRCAIAMENAWRMLYEPELGILKLFAPPFDGEESPGYLAGYLPGVRENGGQYTHAACWALSALHQLGQDGRAWELALRMLPTTHAATRQLAARYRVEPYVMAADIYANPQQRGRGGWTWYTGSASWYWVVMAQQLLGLRKKGNQLRFTPVCPTSWDGLRITYRVGRATYHLHASRDCLIPEADGEALPDGTLTLVDDGKIHEATFPLR